MVYGALDFSNACGRFTCSVKSGDNDDLRGNTERKRKRNQETGPEADLGFRISGLRDCRFN